MLFEVVYANIYRCLGGGVCIHVYVCQQMVFLMQKNERIKNSATCMYIWLCMITFFLALQYWEGSPCSISTNQSFAVYENWFV